MIINFEKLHKLWDADLPFVWPSVFVLQCNHSPVLVHHVASGLRQLCQVGQQRTQVVELSFLVVTFSTEHLHQLRQTNPLLDDLKQQGKLSSLTIQHFDQGSTRSTCSDGQRGSVDLNGISISLKYGGVLRALSVKTSLVTFLDASPWKQSCRSFYGGSGWTRWCRSDQRTGTLDPEGSLTTLEECWHLSPKPGWDTTKNTHLTYM